MYALPLIIIAILFSCVLGAFAGADGGEEAAEAFALIWNCVLFPLLTIGVYITWLFVYAAYACYIMFNYTLREALKVGEVISTVHSKPGPWLILLLVYFVSSLIIPFGLIACIIGICFVAFVTQYCIMGPILGQIITQQGMTSTYTPDLPGYDPSSS